MRNGSFDASGFVRSCSKLTPCIPLTTLEVEESAESTQSKSEQMAVVNLQALHKASESTVLDGTMTKVGDWALLEDVTLYNLDAGPQW